MSDMDDRVRDLLRRKADDVPPHRDVPPSLTRRAHRRMAVNGAVVGAVALVLIAGVFVGFQAFAGSPPKQPIGQPSATTATHPSRTTRPSHSPHPKASTVPIVLPPSPPPSGGTTPARCTVGHLQIAEAGSNGAAGSIQVKVSLRNVGQTFCSLEGYPGMALLSGSTQLPTTVIRGSSVVVPAIHPRLVVLAPGQRAAYVFGYSDVPGGPTCPASTALEVTPPDAYQHATIPFQSTACGGVLTTSPVFLGLKVPTS